MNQNGARYDAGIDAEDFRDGFGEDLKQVLDLESWSVGVDLGEVYRRVDAEVRAAVAQETATFADIRREIFPRLGEYPAAPLCAGVYQAARGHLERIHRGLLFNGGVEACDSTVQAHDTLPLTILQIGVSLVSYLGDQGTWAQRLFQRDLRASGDDPIEELYQLLERREERGGLNQPHRDRLSAMAREGIMAYAERAILARKSHAAWRMGHGSPVPFVLLTGSGSRDLMVEGTRAVRELVEYGRFVFVASEPRDRMLLSIGQALRPLEYAIVRSLHEMIYNTVEHGHFYSGPVTVDTTWDGEKLTAEGWIKRFRDLIGPQVVVGVYRATRLAPPQVFYAHADHAHLAAHIALADSVLQEHRGFPLLIDLADNVCRGVFGRDSLQAPVNAAYAEAGVPWRFLSERASR